MRKRTRLESEKRAILEQLRRLEERKRQLVQEAADCGNRHEGLSEAQRELRRLTAARGGSAAEPNPAVEAPADTQERSTAGADALREGHAIAQALLSNADDGVLLLSRGGTVLDLNPMLAGWLGASREALIGRALGDILPAELAQARLTALVRAITTSRMVRFEDQRGSCSFENTIYPITGPDGSYAHALWTVRDITARHQAESRVRVSEDLWTRTFDAVPDLIAVIDCEYRIQRVNRAMAERLGLSPEACVGKRCFEAVHDENHQIATCPLNRMLQTRVEQSEEVFEKRLGGTFLVSVSPVFDGEGRLVAGVHVARDITARKEAEAKREQLIEELIAKNAELDRYAYSVSHDLKSPLITIRGFLGLMKEEAEEIGATTLLDDIERVTRATERMAALLEDLLELSRIGRIANPPQSVPLADLAAEAIELVAGRLAGGGIEIEVAPGMPAVTGDRTRLVQVFQNLLDNAAKFMGDQPRPRIEIGLRREGGEDVIYVRDNGMGIEPQHRERIFGLFDKLSQNSAGTGVGLALVKRIIEAHGGRIWVESEGRGRGATFCFTFDG